MHPKTLLKIALGAICLMSCSQETLEITPEEQYLRDFIKKFGLVSPDQNWNIAVRLSANVDGPTVSGATEICVLTAPLGSDACRLAARYPASEKTFSMASSQNSSPSTSLAILPGPMSWPIMPTVA